MVQFKKALTVFSFSLLVMGQAADPELGRLGDNPVLLKQAEDRIFQSMSRVGKGLILSAWSALDRDNVEGFNNFLVGDLKTELADKEKFKTFKDSMALDAADGPWSSSIVGAELLTKDSEQTLNLMMVVVYAPEDDDAQSVIYRVVLQAPVVNKEGELVQDDYSAVKITNPNNLKIVQILLGKDGDALNTLEKSIMNAPGISGLEELPTIKITPESPTAPEKKPSPRVIRGTRYDEA